MDLNKERYISTIGIIIVISNFFCMFSFLLLNMVLGEGLEILASIISLLISFMIIPYIVVKSNYNVTIKEIGIKKTKVIDGMLAFIAIIFSIVLLHLKMDIGGFMEIVLQQIFVSIAEEFLMRGIIFFLLLQFLKKRYKAVIVNAIIFAFLLHTGGDIISNLVYRFPAGIILASITLKTGRLYPAIIIHFVYNLWCIYI